MDNQVGRDFNLLFCLSGMVPILLIELLIHLLSLSLHPCQLENKGTGFMTEESDTS